MAMVRDTVRPIPLLSATPPRQVPSAFVVENTRDQAAKGKGNLFTGAPRYLRS
jgi:hypothetical protein